MEIFELIIIFADTLFDVDDDHPFGFQFWLSICVWLVMCGAFIIMLSIFLMLFPGLFLRKIDEMWVLIFVIEILFAWFCYYSGSRTIMWFLQIKNNIQTHRQ